MRILIAGCGYVGEAAGVRLCTDGHDVWGLRRDPSGIDPAIRPVAADLTQPERLDAVPDGLDAVLYCTAADRRDEPSYRAAYVDGLRNLIDLFDRRGESPRIVFCSSTAVYGQRHGEWVDERSAAEPATFTGRILLEAESLLGERTRDGVAVRFGGIYGPRRTRMLDTVRRGEADCPAGPPTYTNRIHREDCAAVLTHLALLPSPQPVYIGVDDDPADRGTVLRWLARQLDAPLPSPSTASPTAAARGQGKRCRNALLHRSGYRLLYPSFREGYAAVIDSLRASASPR